MVWLLGYIAAIWTMEVANTIGGHRLDDLGIVPRTSVGLRGILLGPFLHSGFGHAMSNTVPLAILGSLVAVRGQKVLLRVTCTAALVGGLGIWLFGRQGVHIGASGVVFGYFGFLLARGWYERSFGSTIISVVVLIFYGSMITGALPFVPGVSWEGHLLGLASGVLYARISRRSRTQCKS